MRHVAPLTIGEVAQHGMTQPPSSLFARGDAVAAKTIAPTSNRLNRLVQLL